MKVIIESVSDNLKLNIDGDHLFHKIFLDDNEEEQKRMPFETDFIITKLLELKNLEGLNDDAKAAMFAFAETGAGPAELTGLTAEDIVLDAEIPHIIIRPRQFRGLKTKYRKRIVPLVGHALDAFKAYPKGFIRYVEKADSLSTTLGKFFRENNLLPTERHTLYSLRHSFQDRLLAVNAPDRVQADLMGHKFNRQSYGNGASLTQKWQWLEKIKLKK